MRAVWLSWLYLTVLACGDDGGGATDVAPDVAADLEQDLGPDAPDSSDSPDSPDSDVASDVPATAAWDREQHPWPMFGGDPRRSGRSPFVGPTRADAPGGWAYAAEAAASINMQPTLSEGGIYFGSWGILRGAATADPATSRKSDGHYYGLEPGGDERFTPFEPGPLAACYAYDAPISGADTTWCGEDSGLHVTFYNGTIEGAALVDPWNGRHYVGRGDGVLYAIDPVAGAVVWRFVTFDPLAPDHPDGGGEIVGGPVMDPDGTIYFATFGVPWPATAEAPVRETQAVYAVDREGVLRWRYPSDRSSLDNTVTAAPALSPHGTRLYVVTWLSDPRATGRLLAFDLALGGALVWELALENPARAGKPKLWGRHLSVGDDGVIFVAAAEAKPFGFAPAVAAVRDDGDRGVIAWVAEPHGYADAPTTLVQGLALGDGVLFASTGDVRDFNGREAILAAIDPESGEVIARFDPGDDAPGSMTGPIADAAGHVYVGTRGRHDLFAEPWAEPSQWRRGVMFGVAWLASERRFEEIWRKPVDALLDWATPAIDARGALYFGSTAPLPLRSPADIWEPLEGTPPRTTAWLFAIAP